MLCFDIEPAEFVQQLSGSYHSPKCESGMSKLLQSFFDNSPGFPSTIRAWNSLPSSIRASGAAAEQHSKVSQISHIKFYEQC